MPANRAAKKAATPAHRAAKAAAPAPAEVVVTVTGGHAVDGVAPGGVLPVDPDRDLARLRRLYLGGIVEITVNGERISDAHLVAKIEGA